MVRILLIGCILAASVSISQAQCLNGVCRVQAHTTPIQKPQQKAPEYRARVMFVPIGPLRRCFWTHRYRNTERQWLRLNGGSYVPQEITIRPVPARS